MAAEQLTIRYEPIGIVRSPFTELEGMPLQPVAAADVRGQIEIYEPFLAGLADLDGFSHLLRPSGCTASAPTGASGRADAA